MPRKEDLLPSTLDAAAVRAWCRLSLRALGRAREEIDAINVYPVADGDTGTNLYLTVESAAQAVDAVFDAHATAAGGPGPSFAEAFRALSHGALIGGRGNSGTILAQLLRGMNGSFTADGAPDRAGADDLRHALRAAAVSAYGAVARPVEGTMLTVAARAADTAADAEGGLDAVVLAAYEGARSALAATPGQLGALRRAGVVDAGGLGLVAVLGALAEAVTGEPPCPRTPCPRTLRRCSTARTRPPRGTPTRGRAPGRTAPRTPRVPEEDQVPAGGPAFEVIFLLDADGDAPVDRLRGRLDASATRSWSSAATACGTSMCTSTTSAPPSRPASRPAGRTGSGSPTSPTGTAARAASGRVRAVVAVVPGGGLASLCEQAGATVVAVRPGEPPAGGEIAAAIRRAHAREVVLLPNDTELRHAAGAAAEQARADGVRVALIPTRSAVQGLAALAVHEPDPAASTRTSSP